MSLHLTGDAAALITKLIGSTNKLVLLTVTGILLVQFTCIRGVTSTGMASGDVDCCPVSRYLVPSSEYLDEAVWILGSGDAFQPQLCYLPPILTDVALHLPNALLQRHSSLDLQKTEL